MAFYLQMLEAEATIPNWQASGDFTITAGLKFKAVEELFIGLQSSGNSYIATFSSGELLFKASSAIFTGYNPPINQYIELTITRAGSAISISVDGSEIATGTDSGTMNIDAVGFNSNSGYSGASIDIYYFTLQRSGDNRSYVVTDSGLIDENEVSGTNNATFITPLATYNFVEIAPPVDPSGYNIVWDGDSRTYGTGSDPFLPVPTRVNALLTPTPTFSNFGVGGQQTSDAQSTFNANVVPAYDDTKEFNIYVLNGFGINDCRLGRTSSAIIASLTDLAERAKALGYYVVIATIPPRDTSTTEIEATRVAVNDWIISNTEPSIDLRYDLNSDQRIGVWSSTYYDDISHLNYAGQDIWAENISIAIADEFEGLSTSAASTNQPAANAGANQSVASGATVQLDGTGSSIGGTYEWVQVSGPTVRLINADSAKARIITPQVKTDEQVVMGLTVTVGGIASVQSTVTINIASWKGGFVSSTANVSRG